MDPVPGKGGRNGDQTAKVESNSSGGFAPPEILTQLWLFDLHFDLLDQVLDPYLLFRTISFIMKRGIWSFWIFRVLCQPMC